MYFYLLYLAILDHITKLGHDKASKDIYTLYSLSLVSASAGLEFTKISILAVLISSLLPLPSFALPFPLLLFRKETCGF